MGEAGSGQILVSEVVRMVAPSVDLDPAGVRELKGVEGTWQLFNFA
jgi:class 3 adenylate cyclase